MRISDSTTAGFEYPLSIFRGGSWIHKDLQFVLKMNNKTGNELKLGLILYHSQDKNLWMPHSTPITFGARTESVPCFLSGSTDFATDGRLFEYFRLSVKVGSTSAGNEKACDCSISINIIPEDVLFNLGGQQGEWSQRLKDVAKWFNDQAGVPSYSIDIIKPPM